MTDTATTTLERPASAQAPQPAPHVIEGVVPDAIELPTKPDFIVRGKVAETISAAEKAPQPFEATAQPEPKTPSFDPLIAEARRGWLAMRDSTLLALFGAVPAYNEALGFPDPWEIYCKDRGAKSRFPETAVFELMIMVDEERDEITPTTKSRCGALIAYFAKNCAGMTAQEAVARVKAEGCFVKVATDYRAANPQVALKADGTDRQRPGRKPGSLGTPKAKGGTKAAASTSTGEVVRLGGKPVDLSQFPAEVRQQIAEAAEATAEPSTVEGSEPAGGGEGDGDVEGDGEGDGLWLFPRDQRPIIAEVAELVRAHGWMVTGIRAERGRLDDVFRAITMPQAGAPDPAREAA